MTDNIGERTEDRGPGTEHQGPWAGINQSFELNANLKAIARVFGLTLLVTFVSSSVRQRPRVALRIKRVSDGWHGPTGSSGVGEGEIDLLRPPKLFIPHRSSPFVGMHASSPRTGRTGGLASGRADGKYASCSSGAETKEESDPYSQRGTKTP